MEEKNNAATAQRVKGALLLLILCGILFLAFHAEFTESYSVGANNANVSVDTRVNITNSRPQILETLIPNSVTLVAGQTKIVSCNVSIRDWNGYDDIDVVNATLHYAANNYFDPDDNNTHYTNRSCNAYGVGGNFANYSCNFHVYYYALNGTWNCTFFVNDTYGYGTNATNTTTINELFALNVTPLIDYGKVVVEEYSGNKTANVTNLGNRPINVSVFGYGRDLGDGLAFVCDQGNISVENEKFSWNVSHIYTEKTALSSDWQNISGLTIEKKTEPATDMTNVTYWQIYVPPNPFGICNGTVVFQAGDGTSA